MDPITLYEDRILDGIHREQACHELKTKPAYVAFSGDDPQGFVVSRNLHRRHLTVGERADVALKLLPRYEAEAKERQGTRTDIQPGLAESSKRAPQATERAAKAVGIGRATVNKAKAVKAADPKLWKQVPAGKTSVDAAYRTVKKREGKRLAPKNRGDRAANWNGKTNPRRKRELKARRKGGDYAELVRTQLQINALCSALEATNLDDFGIRMAG